MNRHEMSVEELTAELRSLRDTPSEEFAAALDSRVSARFPGQGRGATLLARLPGHNLARALAKRLRGASPRRKLLPALAGATTVIVVATAVVVATDRDGGGAGGPTTISAESGAARSGSSAAKPATQAAEPRREVVPDVSGGGAVAPSQVIAPEPPFPGDRGAPAVRNRQVERSAQLTLGTDPEHVQEVSGKVFDVVGRYRGIVLSSSVRDGGEGEAGASFDLLIRSQRLGAALADLSSLVEVRSRSENTLDITAPFVSARERLRDARAEAEGLLRQLAEADTDGERASVKAQLRIVRGRIAAFRSQVHRLERRADFSRVSLEIATGEQAAIPGPGGGDWTLGDALHDAGRVLAVAAGVSLIALAVTLPLALLGGAAWAARRIYVRRAREQALGA